MDRFTESIWHAAKPCLSFSPLSDDIEVDVAIVGAGITGLTTAALCAQTGKSVVVLEMHTVGSGETLFSTGHLTQVLDLKYSKLIERFGFDAIRHVVQAQAEAIDFIEKLVRQASDEFGFQSLPGFLFAQNVDEREQLRQEFVAMQNLGIPCEWQEATPLPFAVHGAIHLFAQAQIQPLIYTFALAEVVQKLNGRIFENSMVHEFENGAMAVLKTSRAAVRAKHVVIAANSPVSNRIFIQTKLAAYRTYCCAFRAKHAMQGLFWDMQTPYHYIRSYQDRNGNPYIIVGGEDHKTGSEEQTQKHFERLADYVNGHFGVKNIEYHWSGQILNSCDGLPYIGRNSLSSNVYVATGYSGNGLTYATIAAKLIADAIKGVDNVWAEIFAATRIKPIAGGAKYVSENIDYPKHLLTDWLRTGSNQHLDSIAPGNGAIIQHGIHKLAAYRSSDGNYILLSATCPHLGCTVQFNDAEATWDCPCHGSRFDVYGHVLNGPAINHLQRIELADQTSAQSLKLESLHGLDISQT